MMKSFRMIALSLVALGVFATGVQSFAATTQGPVPQTPPMPKWGN